MENSINSELNFKKYIRIAVVGCLHGNLKDVYDSIEYNENLTGKKVDVLLCCGDFQSLKNRDDLKYLSCPDKYKHMGQFQYYNNSSNPAPILTIFIGGNHEASNVLNENFYGGWICKNIFYLGRAGVIKYKGIRIAGLSGIYKKFDYFKGHFETDLIKDIKSIYHTREFEIAKLSYLKNFNSKIDILMTHDWPTGCVNKRDIYKITKVKKHWREELMTDTLGSPASGFLLRLLKPKLFLSGHMHYTYFNKIYHTNQENNTENKQMNINTANNINSQFTQFIALDKAGTKNPNREYLHIFDYEVESNLENDNDDNIYFDEEWMAITKVFNNYFPFEDKNYNFSNFVINKEEYIKFIADNYNFHWKNSFNNVSFNNNKSYNNCVIFPDNNFQDSITKFYEEIKSYTAGFKWNYIVGNKQREFVTSLIGIEDVHKNKCFNSVKTHDTNLNIEIKNESNIQTNSEEINIECDF